MKPREWAIWAQSSPTVAFALVVDAVAVITVLVVLHATWSFGGWSADHGRALLVAGLLLAAGAVSTELVRVVERTRRFIGGQFGFDAVGVWAFATALLLPPALVVAVVIALYLHSWRRSWRRATPLYRALFSIAALVLAAVAAGAVVAAVRPTIGTEVLVDLVAMAVFAGINQVLVTVVVVIANPQERWHTQLGSWEDNLFELATLCLGGITAAAVATNPLVAVLVPAPVVVLVRSALVRELRQAVDTDGKTGLLTAAAWQFRAERLLTGRRRRTGAADRVIGVLMCDLDHFKHVNDRYGHIVGDHVLREVALIVRAAVRGNDLVSRFGGEEFLVLLVDDGSRGEVSTDLPAAVTAVAERIRARVAAMRIEMPTPDGPLELGKLTISIGAVAVTPGSRRPAHPADLSRLVDAADSAVYAAKRAGRDHVHARRLAITAR